VSNLYRTETLRRIEGARLARVPAGTLMHRAASAVARSANQMARTLPRATPIVGLIGPGNNGGDALLALSILADQGFPVRACALSTDEPGAQDARAVWQQWIARGGRLEPLASLASLLAQCPLVIDGLFGIGLARPLRGDSAAAVIALAATRSPVIAVDVPSGIDADRGCVVGGRDGVAVRADVTVTMIGDKPGLHTGPALDYVGRIELASLEPTEAPPRGSAVAASEPEPAPDGELFGRQAAAALLGPRALDTHKGSFGAVTVIGGATGTTGAALLAARGAQAAGAGKVFIASPDAPVFDPGQPQLMTRTLDHALDDADAVCIGCGLGVGEVARHALANALRSSLVLVLDADALNLIAAEPALARALRARSAGAVLTPHPLEAARLLDCAAADVQADRVASAVALAQRYRATAVLKGAGTVVCDPASSWSIVGSGSPALATAGSGDVLAGCIAALLAQGRAPGEAARLGAWLHGHAAQRWQHAHPNGIGLSAAQLPDLLVQAANAS
jgi:hydroxyethylthiazole kinase-like uncharacterized protein yjeF